MRSGFAVMGSFAVLRPKSRPLYYLAFELKIKLQQVTPASAFCNSDTSIARTRNLRFSRRAHVLGKEAGKITTLLSRSAFAAGARAGVRHWSFAVYKATFKPDGKLHLYAASLFFRHSTSVRLGPSDNPQTEGGFPSAVACRIICVVGSIAADRA